jgi:Mrp family chromosome partitioning ATPase
MKSSKADRREKPSKDSPTIWNETSIREALVHIQHPELEGKNIVDLGMIREIEVVDRQISISLALPFREAPVRDEVIQSVRALLTKSAPDFQVEIEIVEMTPEERASFSAIAQGRDPASQARRSVSNVLAVMSGKGGVGKSSVAGLLACALRRQGFTVGVLDADITGPSIPRLFGMQQAPTGGPEGLLPPTTVSGIKLMSINLLLSDEDQPVVWRGPLIGRAIQQFWSDIVWGDLDYLIIDLPPGTSDAALTVMQSLPVHGIVLVTSPQDLAGMVVRKAANMANKLGLRILGLIENMSYLTCPECGHRVEIFGPSQAAATASQVGVPLFGRIPLDPEMAVMCDGGRIERYENTEFEAIVDHVLKQTTL